VSEWLKGVITMEWDWGNMVLAMSALMGLLAGVIQFYELARSEQSVPGVPGAEAEAIVEGVKQSNRGRSPGRI
jgi:hypothetical protein